MKIKAKLNADVVGFSIKRNKTHDGKTAFVDLEIGVDKDKAVDVFGDDFALLAFATMRELEADGEDDPQSVEFLVDTIKPGHRVVFELHTISLEKKPEKGETEKHKLDGVQPQLLTITPVEGKPSVVAKIRLDVDAANGPLAAFLVGNVGEIIKAHFNPAQGELALPARGNGAEGAAAH